MRIALEMHITGGWWVVGIDDQKDERYQLSAVYKRRKDAIEQFDAVLRLKEAGQQTWARKMR
jgi:hypothetical protein